MRQTFIKALVELAEKDERIYLLTADMGFGLVESFADKFPERFINVGVAENNMIGVATGLALEGKRPFVYSITNFPTLRCLEAIRNNICYHNLPVCIVAGSTGLTYGELGSSHHATEDISVMRSLPNMGVVAPSNKKQVQVSVEDIVGIGSPWYLRLGYLKDDAEAYYPEDLPQENDVALIVTGSMMANTIKAIYLLNLRGIFPTIVPLNIIKPIAVESVALKAKVVVTIEEHSVIGGLGTAVAEILADNGSGVKLKRLGIPDVFCTKVGTRDELLKEYHLIPELIAQEVENALR